jgi:catechol 2,3-dioxygenase-like lactoylglutathione lyase family enzyme
MNQILGATVTIMSTDLDRSIAFYIDTLGFKLLKRYGEHYAEIDASGLLLGLHPTVKTIMPGTNMSIGFDTTDIELNVAHLKTHGMQLSIKQDGPIRIAKFTDPDGNPLYLVER